jgi:hypothetical protein
MLQSHFKRHGSGFGNYIESTITKPLDVTPEFGNFVINTYKCGIPVDPRLTGIAVSLMRKEANTQWDHLILSFGFQVLGDTLLTIGYNRSDVEDIFNFKSLTLQVNPEELLVYPYVPATQEFTKEQLVPLAADEDDEMIKIEHYGVPLSIPQEVSKGLIFSRVHSRLSPLTNLFAINTRN